MPDYSNNIECIRRYHQRTKHRFERYANGPETLDWSMQPNPFRNYAGTKNIPLPLTAHNSVVGYCGIYAPQKIVPEDFNLKSIGMMLELSMGLSAWKEYGGDRWALRCNPSSGNLHPTETYIITTGLDKFEPGIYHYSSYDHALEQRCIFNLNSGTPIPSPNSPRLLVGFSSIFWREAWKYGERAFRYCQLDIGHALAALRYACALLGWSAEIDVNVNNDTIAQLLGLDREQDYGSAEREHPEVILSITAHNSVILSDNIEALARVCQQGQWFGHANILDQHHMYDWPVIDEVADATQDINKDAIEGWTPPPLAPPLPCQCERLAQEIIQRRRSAQMFDSISAIESSDFYRMLDMLTPRANIPPWDTLAWQPKIHIVLFVHRVNGLEPGLYIALRNAPSLDAIKEALLDSFEWLPIEAAPGHLNLYRLVKANSQKAAKTLSCHQPIAADGAFSVGMLSEFDAALTSGPLAYKHLYWEAGMLGQVLYLEAESIDLQGTGIGCYFDDAFHETLGINDSQFQSVYHFTVGGALNDTRLRTLMPYEHLTRR